MVQDKQNDDKWTSFYGMSPWLLVQEEEINRYPVRKKLPSRFPLQ